VTGQAPTLSSAWPQDFTRLAPNVRLLTANSGSMAPTDRFEAPT
jgi:hypothetical protein